MRPSLDGATLQPSLIDLIFKLTGCEALFEEFQQAYDYPESVSVQRWKVHLFTPSSAVRCDFHHQQLQGL